MDGKANRSVPKALECRRSQLFSLARKRAGSSFRSCSRVAETRVRRHIESPKVTSELESTARRITSRASPGSSFAGFRFEVMPAHAWPAVVLQQPRQSAVRTAVLGRKFKARAASWFPIQDLIYNFVNSRSARIIIHFSTAMKVQLFHDVNRFFSISYRSSIHSIDLVTHFH